MYSTFRRNIIFLAYRAYSRRSVSKYLRELELTQWLSTEEIKNLQWQKLKNLLEYAYINVPYYRKVFERLNMSPADITDPADFRELPVLDKGTITDNLRNIVSSTYDKRDLYKKIYRRVNGCKFEILWR